MFNNSSEFDNNYVGKTITDWEKTILNDYFPNIGKKDQEVKNIDKNPKGGNPKTKGKKK